MAEKVRDRIARDLRERIIDGTYPPGSQIPHITELMSDYSAARETVRGAVSQLAHSGLISTVRGHGTFVRDNTAVALAYQPERAAQLWSQQTGEGAKSDQLVSTQYEQAGPDIGERLELDPSDSVLYRVRHHHRGRQVVQLHEVWLPESVVESIHNVGVRLDNVSDPPDQDLFTLMREAGISPTEITEKVLTRMPDPDDLETLQLPPGVPVLMTYRVTRNTKGQPLETSTFTGAGDRISLSYTVPVT